MDQTSIYTTDELLEKINFTIEEEDEEEENNDSDSGDDSSDSQEDNSDDDAGDNSDNEDDDNGDEDDNNQDDDVDIEPVARSSDDDDGDDSDNEDDDEIDSDDEKAISKVVDKKLKDVNKKLAQVEKLKDETEVNAFIQGQPEYAKYKSSALKFMAHPAYKNIPVDNIMAMLSAKDAQKIGAAKERETQRKVKETQTNASQSRKESGGKPDYKNMSSEEFNKAKQEVLQRL